MHPWPCGVSTAQMTGPAPAECRWPHFCPKTILSRALPGISQAFEDEPGVLDADWLRPQSPSVTRRVALRRAGRLGQGSRSMRARHSRSRGGCEHLGGGCGAPPRHARGARGARWSTNFRRVAVACVPGHVSEEFREYAHALVNCVVFVISTRYMPAPSALNHCEILGVNQDASEEENKVP